MFTYMKITRRSNHSLLCLYKPFCHFCIFIFDEEIKKEEIGHQGRISLSWSNLALSDTFEFGVEYAL